MNISHGNGYQLRLNGRFTWKLTAEPALQAWLDRLAHLMEMEPCDVFGHDTKVCLKNQQKSDGPTSFSEKPRPVIDFRTLCMMDLPKGDMVMEINNQAFAEAEMVHMMSAMFPVYRKIAAHGGMAMHAGLAERNGKGFLFAGAGGAGKSTCCRSLPPPWKILCDDLSVVLHNDNDGYEAHPFPTWSDYLWGKASANTWNASHGVALTAIFFLIQSDHDEIIPLRSGSKSAQLNHLSAGQVHQWFWRAMEQSPRLAMRRQIFENSCTMAQRLPSYILRFTLRGRFWEVIERNCL